MDCKKVVILACGSFNPPTNGHLRMLEDAKWCLEAAGKKVLEGIISPVSDGYKKSSLISAAHRIAMVKAAVKNSDWIKADEWECSIQEWTPTVDVLKHHINDVKRRIGEEVGVYLLLGADVVDSFDSIDKDGSPVWDQEDVMEIVSSGLVVQPRPGTSIKDTIEILRLDDGLNNIHLIKNPISTNDVSSTSLRRAIQENRSIKYTTPDAVIEYIREHNLYK